MPASPSPTRSPPGLAALLAALLLGGCDPPPSDPGTPPGDDDSSPAETGDGLFLRGCPEPRRAAARVLVDPAERPWGPNGLAAPGDVLLVNSAAAFVIQSPDEPRTYYHYGGTPIDAVAVQGCEQAGPEVFDEMGLALGRLDLAEFTGSSLHQFRGDSVEIVDDGSGGGPAVVDVHGTDDRFWLVELTLVREVYESGGRKDLGDLYGLDVTVRYTLEPDSAVLRAEVSLSGQPVVDGFMVGALVFPSDHTPTHAFSGGDLSIGGFRIETGVPWFAAGADDGASAVAMPGASMARVGVAGVTALIDVQHALIPLEVSGGAAPVTPFLVAVGALDAASASAALEAHLAEPLPGREVGWADVSGTVADPSGVPVPGATVVVASQDDGGSWRTLDGLVTAEDGSFRGRTLALGPWRLAATAEGRDGGAEVEISPGEGAVALGIGARGDLVVEATDGEGGELPVRVELERDDGRVEVRYVAPGGGSVPLAPGRWTAYASRGYEHALATAEVTVPEGGAGQLEVALPRLVDTAGWASMDSHVHAEPSADSTTLPVDRMRSAAAAGLDAVITTDHEAIVDLSAAVSKAGLQDHLLAVLGSEVTATVPEHTNAWPFPPRSEHPRGEPVVWYGLGLDGIFQAERERGAQVVQLNHSRVNGECGLLCMLDWDRVSEWPGPVDPTAVGLPEGTEIWSWDFDSFEVMNGLRSPFLVEGDPRRTGAFTDWLSFHNLGHRVTGVAVTDVHGIDIPGSPRTYVAVPDDGPGGFTADDLARGVLEGAAVISAGAFARVLAGGAGPGGLATAKGGSVDLWIRVEALPQVDVARVDVLVDCDAALSLAAPWPDEVVKLDETVTLDLSRDAYVVVVGFGAGAMPRGLDGYDPGELPRFVSNPIFVDVDGDGAWTAPGQKACGWEP